MAAPIETELKLILSEAARRRLPESETLRAASAGEPKRAHIVTTYWDTPDHALARRGLSLRVRAQGRQRLQTIKAPDAAGAAMQRREWEQPITGDAPDLALAAGTPIAEFAGAAFAPILTTDVTRTTRMLKVNDARIEADLDEGEIRAGGRSEPIRELELELRHGSPDALYRLALALHAEAPIAIATESKAARGLRLLAGTPPQPRKAAPQRLREGMSGAEAFRRIMAEALGQLVANAAAVSAGHPEGVHQLRVAATRLRTALRLFTPLLDKASVARFERELRALARRVGRARDWSVFCDALLPEVIAESAPVEWSELLADAARRQRDDAFAQAAAAVGEPPFARLALSLGAWVESARDTRLDPPIESLAPGLIGRLSRKARQRSRDAQDGDPTALHELRKALKRLRYGLEFLAGVYEFAAKDGKRIQKLLKRLGQLNDAQTAARLAQSLSLRRRGLAPAAAALAARRDRQQRDDLPRIERGARKSLKSLNR
ncbi:MAG: CHAD domain-containing protein [Pseudomonadota bacterium]|nr:CHAD domain-containing protein [Pseudomonadota bacterium]